MFKFATQAQTAGKAISDSVKLAKSTFSKIWPVALIIGIIQAIQLLIQPPMRDFGPKAAHAIATPPPLPSAGTIIALILMAFVILYFVIILLHRIYNAVQDPQASLSSSMSFAARKYFPVIGAATIVVLIEIVTMLILGALSFGIGALFGLINAQLGNVVRILCFIASGVGMFYLMFLLYFFFPAMVTDNLGVFASIKHSWQITWGNWWHVFVIFFIPILATFAVATGFSTALMLMGSNTMVGFAIMQLVIALFLMPWINSTILVIYNNLKLRNAAKDAA